LFSHAAALQLGNEGRGLGSDKQQDAGRPTGNNSIAAREGERGSQAAQIVPEEGISAISWMIALIGLLMLSAGAALMYSRRRAPEERAGQGISAQETFVPRTGESTLPEYTGFPPNLLERYYNAAYIGMGGTARVFRAERKGDGVTVAVKVPLRSDEATGRCFLREMTIWEHLSHPNIVRLFSVNILPVPYVEMEYVSQSLDDAVRPMEAEMAAEIVRGIAAGLEYAHSCGVIHRDIKPRNILLADGTVPKITDWGLGRVLADPRETVNAGFSLAYAAPEQIAPERFGRTDAGTDIYQLGAIFYELIAGRPPFLHDTMEGCINAILNETPAPLPGIAPYDTIIKRCLAKMPGDRYGSMTELISDLDRAEKHDR
jgi:eukaryotic-like serine/threonine-protein kinase